MSNQKHTPTQMAYPATPELDKMKSAQEKSQAIGDFLDIFLPEIGVTLCRFQEEGSNGEPRYKWKAHVKKAKLDGASVKSRPARGLDAYNGDAELNDDYEAWPDRYTPIYESIEGVLAQYYGIDLDKCEQERRAVLNFVRSSQERSALSQARGDSK